MMNVLHAVGQLASLQIVPDHNTGRLLQRSAISAVPVRQVVPQIVQDVVGSSGQPLEESVRTYMEPRFGHDFSGVRVHTDARAVESAGAVNAVAYTVGNHIAFASGQYHPDSSDGRRILAHELAHVVQQSGRGFQTSVLPLSVPTDGAAEREADVIARGVLNNIPTRPFQSVVPGAIARQQASEDDAPGVLGTIAGGLMGEFNEDPSLAMIGVDLGVSLVPILDQVSDARDITAHIYYMTVYRQYDRLMRWIGLVFTLIGLVPEVGSVIKSASKFLIKGVREVIDHLDDILRVVRRVLPEVTDVARLQRYIASHWTTWVDFGIGVFNRSLERISSIANTASLVARSSLRQITDMLAHIRRIAPDQLRGAYQWARRRLDDVLEEVRNRLDRSAGDTPSPQQVPTGQTPKPPTLSHVQGAEEIRVGQADYESALGRVFPSQFLNQITRTMDDVGNRAAQNVAASPLFVQAVENRNWKLAGTLFHSAAAREARALPAAALPPGWTIQAEHVIQAGKGGSRADILLRGPAGELIEIDWKTTGRSALSSQSREEMTRHAGQIAVNVGGTLTTQQSRSWVDFVRPLLPGLSWP